MILALAVSPHVRADEGPFPYTEVVCNAERQAIAIQEEWAYKKQAIPNRSTVRQLYDLMEIRSDPKDLMGDHWEVTKTFETHCRLGAHRYMIAVKPWKFSPRVNSMCGGDPPSTQLTVIRDDELLIRGLVFNGFCNPPESDLHILKIEIFEADSSAVVETAKGRFKFSFKEIGALERQNIETNERRMK